MNGHDVAAAKETTIDDLGERIALLWNDAAPMLSDVAATARAEYGLNKLALTRAAAAAALSAVVGLCCYLLLNALLIAGLMALGAPAVVALAVTAALNLIALYACVRIFLDAKESVGFTKTQSVSRVALTAFRPPQAQRAPAGDEAQ